MADDAEDPWGFLAKRPSARADSSSDATSPSDVTGSSDATSPSDVTDSSDVIEPSSRREQRAHGEFRASMTSTSLKRRAWPMALCLALVSVAGFLTEAVAATQIVARAGAPALFIVYPLGGLGLILLALLQFKYVDRHARLKVLRVATLGYAVAFIVALILLGAGLVPVLAMALIYLMGDQLNFLVPLLIWSLAGDEFNVAEGRKIFGWIVAWTYGGQLAGLAIATVSPPLLDAVSVPLPVLLVIDPIVCIFIALWLPRMLRGSSAAQGVAGSETLRQAVAGARDFIDGVPVWRSLLVGSILTFVGGMTVFLSFMVGEDEIIGADAGRLQMFFAGVMLASLVVCLLLQAFAAERMLERLGIPGVLSILPVATIIGGMLLVAGLITGSLVLVGLGLASWFIPRWSIDENARRAALALVPDERRTRVSFVVDLLPVSLGLVIAGPLAAIGWAVGQLWLVPALAALVTIGALPAMRNVRAGWEDSLLNWRLRRRKQNRTLNLGDE